MLKSAPYRWCSELVRRRWRPLQRSTSGARQPRAYMVRRPTSAYRLSSARLPRPTLLLRQKEGWHGWTPLDTIIAASDMWAAAEYIPKLDEKLKRNVGGEEQMANVPTSKKLQVFKCQMSNNDRATDKCNWLAADKWKWDRFTSNYYKYLSMSNYGKNIKYLSNGMKMEIF